jgi:hypothetical protein
LDSGPELLGNNRLDLARDDVLLRVAPALSAMLAIDSRLFVKDLDPAVDRVGEDGRQAGLVRADASGRLPATAPTGVDSAQA